MRTSTTAVIIGASTIMCLGVLGLREWDSFRSATAIPKPPEVVRTPGHVAVVLDEDTSQFAPSRSRLGAASARSGFYDALSGTTLRFAIHVHQETALSMAGDSTATSNTRLEVDGELELRILARHENQILASLSYPSLDLELDDGQGTSEHGGPDIKSELALVADLRIGSDGTIRGWKFPKAMSSGARNLERTLLAQLRFVTPGGATDSWITHEQDSTGAYMVSYRRISDDGRNELVTRQRDAECQQGSPAQLGAISMLVDSGEAIFDHSIGWLTSVSCRSRMEMTTDAAGIRVEATSSGNLELLDIGVSSSVDVTEVWGGPWTDDIGQADRRADADALQARQEAGAIQGLTLDGVVRNLSTVIATSGIDSREVFDARELMKALLRSRPADLQQIKAIVLVGGFGEDVIGVVLSAIGSVGTQDGQAYLSEILSDPLRPENVRLLSLFALFQVTDLAPHTASSVSALWTDVATSQSVRSTALLLLGTFARLSADGRQVLLMQADRAAADGMLSSYVTALGNAHLFEEVATYAHDSDADVRAAAEGALASR